MLADPALPGWGGRSAPPPHAGGGRAAIQPSMVFILLRLAKRLRRAHVRGATNVGEKVGVVAFDHLHSRAVTSNMHSGNKVVEILNKNISAGTGPIIQLVCNNKRMVVI